MLALLFTQENINTALSFMMLSQVLEEQTETAPYLICWSLGQSQEFSCFCCQSGLHYAIRSSWLHFSSVPIHKIENSTWKNLCKIKETLKFKATINVLAMCQRKCHLRGFLCFKIQTNFSSK